MRITRLDDPAERSRVCAAILSSLPAWFGIESANDAYVRDVEALTTFAIEDKAFLALKRHTSAAAEIYVMAVVPDRHRQGLGRALVRAAEDHLRAEGVEYLQVKTLGPSNPSAEYARTRRFYDACGFTALEEIHGLWDEHNPCLLMVKRL